MKIKLLSLLFLLISAGAFAQKKEVRKIDKLLDKNDPKKMEFAEAEKILETIDTTKIASLNKRDQSTFYANRGMIKVKNFFKSGGNPESLNMTPLRYLKGAYQDVSKASDIGGLSSEDQRGADQFIELINSTIIGQIKTKTKRGDYKGASDGAYALYQLKPKDTLYLLVAANSAFYAKEDKLAIDYYERLHKAGYKGTDLQYTAKDKKTGEVQAFASKTTRDLYIKSGDYTEPKVRRAESKEGEIIKHLALLYLRNDQKDKALDFIKQARKSNPNDVQMLKAEAVIYQQTENKEKAKSTLLSLTHKDPDNAAQYYVMLGEYMGGEGNEKQAKTYYEKALESDPKSVDALQGMANSYLKKQEKIVKEMNTLGMSKADTKRYDELAEDRKNLIKQALPYVEKILKVNPDNARVIRTLYQLNVQLRNKEEAEKYKKMMEDSAGQDSND